MRIISINTYRDGGTYCILTDKGEYYVDRRIHTETPYSVYDKYPDKEEACIVNEVKDELLSAIKDYEMHVNVLPRIIENLKGKLNVN